MMIMKPKSMNKIPTPRYKNIEEYVFIPKIRKIVATQTARKNSDQNIILYCRDTFWMNGKL